MAPASAVSGQARVGVASYGLDVGLEQEAFGDLGGLTGQPGQPVASSAAACAGPHDPRTRSRTPTSRTTRGDHTSSPDSRILVSAVRTDGWNGVGTAARKRSAFTAHSSRPGCPLQEPLLAQDGLCGGHEVARGHVVGRQREPPLPRREARGTAPSGPRGRARQRPSPPPPGPGPAASRTSRCAPPQPPPTPPGGPWVSREADMNSSYARVGTAETVLDPTALLEQEGRGVRWRRAARRRQGRVVQRGRPRGRTTAEGRAAARPHHSRRQLGVLTEHPRPRSQASAASSRRFPLRAGAGRPRRAPRPPPGPVRAPPPHGATPSAARCPAPTTSTRPGRRGSADLVDPALGRGAAGERVAPLDTVDGEPRQTGRLDLSQVADRQRHLAQGLDDEVPRCAPGDRQDPTSLARCPGQPGQPEAIGLVGARGRQAVWQSSPAAQHLGAEEGCGLQHRQGVAAGALRQRCSHLSGRPRKQTPGFVGCQASERENRDRPECGSEAVVVGGLRRARPQDDGDPLGTQRRAANSNACTEGRSTQCRSSTRTTTVAAPLPPTTAPAVRHPAPSVPGQGPQPAQ